VLTVGRNRSHLPRPDGQGRELAADLPLAVSAAHRQLELRAVARDRSLGVHARRALDSELTRAEAYYNAALESIARRRASAPADRARLLDAQAEATRAERARRRHEIEDEYRPRHEIRPFRLHLVHLPAFVLPISVRRGSRTFQFELTWVAAAAEFVSVRCPACGTAEPLVVTRERLGCRACTASTPARSPGVRAPGTKANGPPSSRPTPPTPAPAPAPAPIAADPKRPPAQRARSAGAPRPSESTFTERTGNKLAYAFWRCVASGDRWPRQKAARDSPLRAVYRLYGNEGPARAIGIPAGHLVDEMTATTYPTEPGAPELSMGSVTADGESYRYAMFWSMQAGKPVLGEVMPAPHPLALPPIHGEDAELGWRLRELAPEPTVELDPVASTLWAVELEHSGLPFAIRCLATWWRAEGSTDPSWPSAAVAAAVAAAVSRAADTRRTRARTATIYETDLASIVSVEEELTTELRLDRGRGW
jgi:hypothetical protein